MKSYFIIIKVLTFLSISSVGYSGSILIDSFSDLNRDNQNLPSSSQWYTSSPSIPTNLTADASGMVGSGFGGSGTTMLTYFGTDSLGNTPVSLAIGDRITVQFQFTLGTLGSGGANSFRVGLFDSTTSTADPKRISADSFANANPSFVGYNGYATWTNFTSTAGNLQIRERDSTTDALITGTTAIGLGSTSDAIPALLESATSYLGTYSITRSTADQVDIAFNLTGGTLSNYSIERSDIETLTTSFDTLALFANTRVADSITFRSVSIDVAAIPEPSTFGILAGLFAFGLTIVKRKSKLTGV